MVAVGLGGKGMDITSVGSPCSRCDQLIWISSILVWHIGEDVISFVFGGIRNRISLY